MFTACTQTCSASLCVRRYRKFWYRFICFTSFLCYKFYFNCNLARLST